MKVKVQVTIEHEGETESGGEPLVADIARFERDELSTATLGLTLAEGKALLAGVQQTLVTAQTAIYLEQHCECSHCGAAFKLKGQHTLTMRTLFGKLELASPRYHCCVCQEGQAELPQQKSQQKSFSPLVTLLPERTASEFQYLQTKWAALMSYGLTADTLEEVLPLGKPMSTAVLAAQVAGVADRAVSELSEEQAMFA